MSSSYGHAYLTSYGWTGAGSGLRDGAIAKPLAIPQKKNLSGLGKDRDEAFPFWDHLFVAASKAISIKVSSDDEDPDETEDPSASAPADPLRRTTTGILSNRRPISGTPASASGNTTPSPVPDADADAPGGARPSLLAIAKREAAKHRLYARFFRGPVLGPDDDTDLRAVAGTSHVSPEPSPPVPQRAGGCTSGETRKSKKRKSRDRLETKEERRERKRLKRERKAARAAKRAEKNSAGDEAKKKKNRIDRETRKYQHEVQSAENTTIVHAKKMRKKARGVAAPGGGDAEHTECAPKRSQKGPQSTDVGQQATGLHRLLSNMDTIDSAPATKKGKRKDTSS